MQQFIIPVLGMNIEQHGTTGIGRIRDMGMPCHHMVDQEAVHCAETEFSFLGFLLQVKVIKNPPDLASGKIGIRHKTGFFDNDIPPALLHQSVHNARCPPALPYNGVVHAPSGIPFPDHGGFALIGDSDGCDVLRRHAGQTHGTAQRIHLGLQNHVGIVFHPAGLRINLRKLFRVGREDMSFQIKNDAARTGGTLIQRCQHFLSHKRPPYC